MIGRELPLPREGSIFDSDELVFQGLLVPDDAKEPDGVNVPRFGDTGVWDFNGVIRRPAPLPPVRWRLSFSEGLAETQWNLLSRETLMIMLNPRHPAVTAAGLSLQARPYKLATLPGVLSVLRSLANWGAAHGLPVCLAAWTTTDVRWFIAGVAEGSAASTTASYINVLKRLHLFSPALAAGGLAVDPWPGKSAFKAANVAWTGEVSTPVIRPEVWFPLIRAAWTYVHVFAPDILRGAERLARLHELAVHSTAGLDARLDGWLADPASRIPVHPDGAGTAGQDVVHWEQLNLLLGVDARMLSFRRNNPGCRARRDKVLAAVAAGVPTTVAVINDLAEVVRPDGNSGPWHAGLSPSALRRERVILRGACFTLVVGLSMMRHGEILDITRGSLTEHYGSPAIASTHHKHQPGTPTKHWWIIEPVAEAITVAEHNVLHDNGRVFTAAIDGGNRAAHGEQMLDTFVAHVNAHRAHTGLAEIPADRVRPHMFRRTMSMLTDQFAGSEIALGIQLKHVAARALANRSTQGYSAADVAWASHLDSAIDAARFRRLEDLYHTHTAGHPIGYGPGAGRLTSTFDQITQTVAARGGDATSERALLKRARISIRFGTLNHCLFDPAHPAGALCLEQATVPPGHTGPLIDRCRPGRCANSVIGTEHLPLYQIRRHGLLQLVDTPGLPAPRRELLDRELTEIDTILRRADRDPE